MKTAIKKLKTNVMNQIKFNNGMSIFKFKNKFIILNHFGILHPQSFDTQSDAIKFMLSVYNVKFTN